MPDNKKLFSAFLGLLGILGCFGVMGYAMNQPSDLWFISGLFVAFFTGTFMRRYINFLRRIFCEKAAASD